MLALMSVPGLPNYDWGRLYLLPRGHFALFFFYMLLLCGYANEGSDRETKGSVCNTHRDFSTTNLVKRVRIIHG